MFTLYVESLSLTQVDEIMCVNREREGDGHSTEKGGPQKTKETEEDSLQFFPSPYQHTDSDITDTDVSGVQPMDHTFSSTCTPEWCKKDREVSMCCDPFKQKNGEFALNIENEWILSIQEVCVLYRLKVEQSHRLVMLLYPKKCWR